MWRRVIRRAIRQAAYPHSPTPTATNMTPSNDCTANRFTSRLLPRRQLRKSCRKLLDRVLVPRGAPVPVADELGCALGRRARDLLGRWLGWESIGLEQPGERRRALQTHRP